MSVATKHPTIILHMANSLDLVSKLAVSEYVNGVEIDLRMTADGVVIVHHDRRVKDNNGRFHWIDKCTYNDLSEMNGEYILTFEAFLAKITKQLGSNFILDIDLKQKGMEKKIAKLVRKYPVKSIVACSPDIWTLYAFEKEYPKAKLGLTYSFKDRWDFANNKIALYLTVLFQVSIMPFVYRIVKLKTANKKIDIASIHHRSLNKKTVQYLQNNGIEVYAYAADNKKHISRMAELGVDIIKTKRPEIVEKAFYK